MEQASLKFPNEKTVSLDAMYPINISFKNKSKIKHFQQIKSEIIHLQQTYTVRNVKHSSVRKKMIPDRQVHTKK